ncbi:MAG TPA: SAM-dependent methyltransferase [Thermoanaerobaculia bacterium]|jgi:methyltransferase (TIGR00027 family)|nr:SAM-dependent methyltransferase [Thermoanaerobaculia bacterium]
MNQAEPLIRNVSDTALWAAVYRAAETERPDALFADPYARRLAGDRGRQIAESVPGAVRADWAWVGRTYLFDQLIVEQLRQGADMVVNLAAGLDARPYRMDLPPALQWIEVDLPGILDYKEEILAGEQPRCALERVRLDLSDGAARRELFARLGSRSRRALILTEGLLIYLTRDEVASLARDLAAPPPFKSWILDIASPGLLRLLQKNLGPQLTRASATLQFGPPEGPGYFEPYGWKPVQVLSPLKTAARFKRLSFGMRLFALLPESQGRQGSRPWSGICLLEKTG